MFESSSSFFEYLIKFEKQSLYFKYKIFLIFEENNYFLHIILKKFNVYFIILKSVFILIYCNFNGKVVFLMHWFLYRNNILNAWSINFWFLWFYKYLIYKSYRQSLNIPITRMDYFFIFKDLNILFDWAFLNNGINDLTINILS